jgi:glutamate formiminotransferase
VLECVINISEGRNPDVLDTLSVRAGASLRDRHTDQFHNRSVFTLINDSGPLVQDVRALITSAFAVLDLRTHEGVHPRFGVVDVVPFVALDSEDPDRALFLRDECAQWIAGTFDVPIFLYGPVGANFRSLPEVRNGAFRVLTPDFGPANASSKLGAVALGARGVLVAWNLWLEHVSRDEARALAKSIRRSEVRSLAFRCGESMQVSCNLIQPSVVGPGVVFDEVLALLPPDGQIVRAELVGLVPRSVLEAEDESRWAQLGLSENQTIEGRL